MYQLIIHWDNRESEIICQGTQVEIYQHISQIADTINPNEALWELKWVPNKAQVKETSLNNIMGKVERME